MALIAQNGILSGTIEADGVHGEISFNGYFALQINNISGATVIVEASLDNKANWAAVKDASYTVDTVVGGLAPIDNNRRTWYRLRVTGYTAPITITMMQGYATP